MHNKNELRLKIRVINIKAITNLLQERGKAAVKSDTQAW